jgi:hypothetical protein
MHLLPDSVATQIGFYDKWFYLLWTDNVEVSCIMISYFLFSSVFHSHYEFIVSYVHN